MYLITLIGLLLRLSYINKPTGLWNDEYVSWMVSATPFNNGFWQAVLDQCHMPLYYLYLKPFSGFSDTILRLTSVIPGVIAIWIMYLVGKEYSKKVGYYAGSITAFLSFLIYYSQEVRFYSLLFLFSACSLLFTIKLLKKRNLLNIVGYIISNVLILLTHVLCMYVIFNVLYVVYKLCKDIKFEKFKKNELISVKSGIVLCGIGIFIIAFMSMIYFGFNIIAKLPSSQWWGNFSYTNILFMFSDYFSPILTNKINAPSVFFYNLNISGWMLFPTLLAVIAMFCGIKQNKGIFTVAFLTVLSLSLLAYYEKILFITKYTIEILPILLTLMACGFDRLKQSGAVLIVFFISFHIMPFFAPFYVTKLSRDEGNKIVGNIINYRNPQKVIFTYYAPDRFYRYWNQKAKPYYISKINRFEYKDHPEKILTNVNKGERVSVVFLESVSFFPEDYINENRDKLPEMYVTFSHIKNMLVKELNDNYIDYTVDMPGSWIVITATKK